MNYNSIHDKIYTSEYSSQFENEFIELYNSQKLTLSQIPHNYRSNGFFYEECRRLGEFDLIPTLLKDERIKLKEEYEILMSSLNRVDASSLQLIRVKANEHYFRALIYQLLNEGLYWSLDIREKLDKIGKNIEELPVYELLEVTEEILRFFESEKGMYVYMFIPHIIDKGYTIDDMMKISKNRYNQKLNYENFPTLFTDLCDISFDQGGLTKLELYQSQMYRLFTFSGECLTPTCQDLELTVNGKYLYRETGNEPGFHLFKYNCITRHSNYLECFDDLSGVLNEIIDINSKNYYFDLKKKTIAKQKDLPRDFVEFDSNGFPIARIENFEKPTSREKALEILNDRTSNWILSPQLVQFFENDKELAEIAIKRDKRAFTLINNELQKDTDLIKLILDYNYCLEYNLKPEDHLTDTNVKKLFYSNPMIMRFLSDTFNSNKELVLSCLNELKDDNRNYFDWIKYLNVNLLKDKEIAMVFIKKNPRILYLFDDKIKNDEEIVTIALQKDGNVLNYLNDAFRNNKKFVAIAFQQCKSSIRFASVELQNDPDFKID